MQSRKLVCCSSSHRIRKTIMRVKERLCGSLALASAVLIPQLAMAGWGANSETIVNHPTWVYTPSSTLKSSTGRGLMVVLHGCDQTNDQLKTFGNLEASAEDNGLVLAVPAVGNHPKGPGCWDYDGGADASHHASEIVALTQDLLSRSALNIDRDHVY